jgi:hypothetical protein
MFLLSMINQPLAKGKGKPLLPVFSASVGPKVEEKPERGFFRQIS